MLSQMKLYAAFWVPGKPRAQQRPRAVQTLTGKVRVYDSGNANDWKAAIAGCSRSKRPAAPLPGPVGVELRFFFARPRRLWPARHPDGAVPCVAKPDLDNLEKPVLDVLTREGWWRDDAQVCSLSSSKHYAARAGAGAGVMVGVYIERNDG